MRKSLVQFMGLGLLILSPSESHAHECSSANVVRSFDPARATQDAEMAYPCVGPQYIGIIVIDEQAPDVFGSDKVKTCLLPGSDVLLVQYKRDSEMFQRAYGTLDDLTAYARAYNQHLVRIMEKQGKQCLP